MPPNFIVFSPLWWPCTVCALVSMLLRRRDGLLQPGWEGLLSQGERDISVLTLAQTPEELIEMLEGDDTADRSWR